jgi:ankyrin repeat protein
VGFSHSPLIASLSNRGLDVNTIRDHSDEENLAPVHVAARNNLCELGSLLPLPLTRSLPLSVDLLKWLVARQVDINSVTSMLRKTPLMLAAEQ